MSQSTGTRRVYRKTPVQTIYHPIRPRVIRRLFVEALDKVLGSASALVKMQILQAIESSQEVIGTSTTITEFKAKISEMSCITSSNNNNGGNAK